MHSFQYQSSAEDKGGCGPALGRPHRSGDFPQDGSQKGYSSLQNLLYPPQHPSLMRRGRALRPGSAHTVTGEAQAQRFLGRYL